MASINTLNAKFNKSNNDLYEKIKIELKNHQSIKGFVKLVPVLSNYRKFSIKVYYEKYMLELINSSNDYHNNFRLYKSDNKIKNKLIKKYYNYSNHDSRITQTRKIISSLLKSISHNKSSNFEIDLGLRVQKLIHCSNLSNQINKKIFIKNVEK